MSHNYKGKQLFALVLTLLFITALNLAFTEGPVHAAPAIPVNARGTPVPPNLTVNGARIGGQPTVPTVATVPTVPTVETVATVPTAPPAALTFKKSVTPTVLIGDVVPPLENLPTQMLTYTLRYTNTGSVDLLDLVVTEVVPFHTTFVKDASSAGWSCADGSGPTTICLFNIAQLPVNTAGSILFVVKVTRPLPQGVTMIINQASINAVSEEGPVGLTQIDDGIAIVEVLEPMALDEEEEPMMSAAHTLWLPIVHQ